MRDDVDDYEDTDLPSEAITNENPIEINNEWLGTASREEQLTAMRAWWFARYENPANSTPYNGREGGYLYINGGPFDPSDELPERFFEFVDEDLIQELVDELHEEVGSEWEALTRYEDAFDVAPHERDEPVLHLTWALTDTNTLVALAERERSAQAVLLRHAFISLVAAFETYLWETTKYWVTTENEVLRNIVVKSTKFKDRELRLGSIFDRHEKLNEEVNDYLKNMVWHRLDEVKPLMQVGMGITLPSVEPLLGRMVVRHDLVHRNGRSTAGQTVYLKPAHVAQLKRLVLEFCIAVEVDLAKKWPDSVGFSERALREELEGMGTQGIAEPSVDSNEDF